MKLYLDEDISSRVAELLRKYGVDAVSAHEKGMKGASDEEQLTAAIHEARVMVTRNRNDFIALTVRFFQDFKPHFGVIIVPYSLPGSNFSLLADRLSAFTKKHPKGIAPYIIEFVSTAPTTE